MGTNAGTVSIDLDAKIARFESDLGRAAKMMERDLARAAKTSQRALGDMERQAKAAGVAIGTALVAAATAAAYAIKKSIDAMDEMSKSAQRAGMPTEEFSKLAYAASLADVSMQDLQGTMGKLVKNQAAALKGTSEQAKVFASLGIAVVDTEGKLRSAGDVFADFADAYQRQQGSPEIMAAGFQVMGKSFQSIIPLIKDGSAGLRAAGIEAEQLGKVLSTKAGQDAERFNDDITRMQGALAGATQQIAIGMLPKLNEMSGDMVAAAKQTDNLRQFGEGLATVLGGLGKAFGFVAGMARQFGVDMATAVEVAQGWAEITKNASTLGMADGTLSGGKARIDAALKTRREMLDGMKKGKALADAEAALARTVAGLKYVDYTGPLLEDGSSTSKSDESARVEAERKRLAAAFGGAESSGKGRRASASAASKRDMPNFTKEDTDALRQAVQAASDASDRFDDLAATLAGPLAQAQREYQKNLAEIDRLAKEGERTSQEAMALKEQETARYKEQATAIEAQLNPGRQLLADMEFEISLLRMTNAERQTAIQLRGMDAEAVRQYGAAILQANQTIEMQSRAVDDQVQMMDTFRESVRGIFSDIYHGKNAWDAVKNAFDRFADAMFDFASKKVMEQIFGQSGTTQTGSAGGGWAGLIQSFLGAWSGSSGGFAASSNGVTGQQFADVFSNGGAFGFARGGYTGPGGVNDPAGIVHRGEVVWSQADVTSAGGVAAVEAMRNGRASGNDRSSAGSGMTVVQNFNNPRMYDRSSDAQRQAYAAERLKIGMKFA